MDGHERPAARTGWSLTAERIVKRPEGLDLPELLGRIESEMGNAAPEMQWVHLTLLHESTWYAYSGAGEEIA